MTAHQLAAALLRMPDRPIALHVYKHQYDESDRLSHGPMQAAVFRDKIYIGPMLDESFRKDACVDLEQ